jgi:hypothetical protein
MSAIASRPTTPSLTPAMWVIAVENDIAIV